MLGYISPIATYIEEFLDHLHLLNSHTKLGLLFELISHIFVSHLKTFSEKYRSIRELCRFIQPGLISSMTFLKETRSFKCLPWTNV